MATHLLSVGIELVTLTGSTPPDERAATLDGFEVVIATRVLLDLAQELPDRLLVVWWSAPRNWVDAERRLDLQASASDSQTVVLLPTPPLPADRFLADLLTVVDERLPS